MDSQRRFHFFQEFWQFPKVFFMDFKCFHVFSLVALFSSVIIVFKCFHEFQECYHSFEVFALIQRIIPWVPKVFMRFKWVFYLWFCLKWSDTTIVTQCGCVCVCVCVDSPVCLVHECHKLLYVKENKYILILLLLFVTLLI